MALSRIKGGSGERGKEMAVAGIVLSIIATLLWVGIAVVAIFASDNTSSWETYDSVTDARSATSFWGQSSEPEEGECVVNAQEATYSELTVVDCERPHDGETAGSATIADGPYPGDAAIERVAESKCKEVFADYVGTSWNMSSYTYTYYFPSEETWADGDRSAVCIVVTVDGSDLPAESVAGSGL